MAAAGALNVVKQIQALAEGPRTPEMRECLGQVVSSLLFFLDHPDSRVRLSAARTLVKLASGYKEEVAKLEMSRARAALSRCKKSESEGSTAIDNEELRRLLEELLDEGPDCAASSSSAACTAPAAPAAASTAAASAAAPAATPAAPGDGRGQVVLKVAQGTDGKQKAAILEKVVVLAGVVSVTFEGPFVIVSTKTPATAADASFLADLLLAVRSQGLEGVSLVSTGERAAFDASATASPAAAASPMAAEPEEVIEEEEEDEAEPAYLDDDEDEVAGPVGTAAGGMSMGPGMGPGMGPPGMGLAGGPGAANWSFFSQTNWMTGRRVQEFGDDPTIAARLAKAKKKEEEKREEEKTRIGRLSNWLMGGR